jgi:hypothetical protein
VFERPQEFRAEKAAEDPGRSRIGGLHGQRGANQFAAKQPEPDEGRDRDHDAKAGHLEGADAEQDWVHVSSTSTAPRGPTGRFYA